MATDHLRSARHRESYAPPDREVGDRLVECHSIHDSSAISRIPPTEVAGLLRSNAASCVIVNYNTKARASSFFAKFPRQFLRAQIRNVRWNGKRVIGRT